MINGQLIKKSRSSGAFGASAGIVFFIVDFIFLMFPSGLFGDRCHVSPLTSNIKHYPKLKGLVLPQDNDTI